MKQASLLAAVSIVLAANALALMHAWRNRSGPLAADLTLTQRELQLEYHPNDDDSGVALDLRWIDPARDSGLNNPASWMDERTLRELGFDVSVAPSDSRAQEFYQRQRPRRAFVALEYDGPGWRRHVEEIKSPPANRDPGSETHLVVIAAASDAARLRARYPDRNSVIIVPAALRIALLPSTPAASGKPARPAKLYASVVEIPLSIYVPRPFSDALRGARASGRPEYRVHLRYGRWWEPWVAGVDILK